LEYALGSMVVIYTGVAIGSGVEGLTTPIHLLFASWAIGAVFIGDATRNRGRYVTSLRERARQAEETREQEAKRRVAEERVRIARDLHDVVAHSLATITVQAAAGTRVFDAEPAQARAALEAIRQTSKQALQDLGVTLAMLHSREDDAPRAPAPSLADIATLLEAPATAGVHVVTETEGQTRALDPAVDMAAYRILQESLTNIVRHANASEAHVAFRFEPAFIELEVSDNGTGPIGGSQRRGLGLVGMRERAESVGGSFSAGPREKGGFRVWTRLPTGSRS
jgi:signal transduction histidine kinase